MSVPQPVPKWDSDTVCNFVSGIGLPQLVDKFRENAVTGADLISLSDDDYKDSLGCTGLQMKKIRKELEAYGIHATPSGNFTESAAAAVAVAPPPSAPAAAAPTPPPSAPAAPAPGGPDVGALQARAAEAQRGAQAYAGAQAHLRRADQGLASAAGSLTVTQASSGMNMIQDLGPGRRGGFGHGRGPMGRRNDAMHTAVETATIAKANGLMKQAGEEINAARQLVPQMPGIQEANVKAALGGVFFNQFFFRGTLGNVMEMAAVNKAKGQVNEMRMQVKAALDWCTNSVNAAQAEAATLQAQIAAAGH